MSEGHKRTRVHIIGAGLIGTSIGLCLKAAGYEVTVEDRDKREEALARDLIKAPALDPGEELRPKFVFVSVPPAQTSMVIVDALKRFPSSMVVDVASTKTQVMNQVEDLSDELNRYIPSHPIAGRETGGAASAQADLFKGRAWVITPHNRLQAADLKTVRDLIATLGATPYLMDAQSHDRLFALISHLPQILSSSMASLLDEEIEGVALAGQGLRDMTRLAESDFALWREIIDTNRGEILQVLGEFQTLLESLTTAIKNGESGPIGEVFARGKSGKSRISGKHGAKARNYSVFRIVIDDRPGVLGELFSLCAKEEINIEDLDLEHSPSQETGLISLAVQPEQSTQLSTVLKESGWTFHLVGSTI